MARWMLTVSLTLLALACQPGNKRRLVIGVPAGPASINPNAMNEEFTLSVLSNIYETVVGSPVWSTTTSPWFRSAVRRTSTR